MADRPRGLGHFLAELKRRRVARVAVMYIAVAFAILQGADVLVEALQLPGASLTILALAVLLGFPIALALAWIFDITPDGVRRTESFLPGQDPLIERTPWVSPYGLALALLLVILAGAGGWLLRTYAPSQETSATADRAADAVAALPSIAVLAFADLSPQGDQEYFSDGTAEEILNVLATIPGLRVAARTSSFAFKGKNTDVRTVGAELGVSTVLEGSVRKEGDRLRITAQLINAEDGFHLWSRTYDRRLESVFAIQEEIAHAIVDALRVPLGLRPQARLVVNRTEDIEAYDLYLQGRHLISQRGPSLSRAIALFETALERDPRFAPAYAGIAESQALLPYYNLGSFEESLPVAERAARQALSLDSTLAQAHTALANVLRDRWDWAGAEREYRRALALSPDDVETNSQFGQWHVMVGRAEDGLAYTLRARDLDPLSPHKHTMVGWHLYYLERYEEAIAALREAVHLDPDFPLAHYRLYWAYLLTHRYPDAEREARLTATFAGSDPDVVAAAVRAIADGTGQADALAALEADPPLLTDEARRIDLAMWSTLLGNTSRGLDLLEQQIATGFGDVAPVLWDPVLEPLRDDPRFQAAMKRTGIASAR